MRIIFVWFPRMILAALLAAVLFVTIPTYVPYQPCRHGEQPYRVVFGLPWMTEPCNYAGLAWEAPFVARVPQFLCIISARGACD